MDRFAKASGRSMVKSSVGRVFCVTGMPQVSHCEEPEVPAAVHQEFIRKCPVSQADSESNSSGYLSSSSFESSSEERRLTLNEEKVFNVWYKWSRRVQIPKSSTPIQDSERVVSKTRINLSSDSGKSMLSIKKNLNEKPKTKKNTEMLDSFWDIPTPKHLVHKSSSENDVRKSNSDNRSDHQNKRSSLPSHDAGLDVAISSSSAKNWKRKPFLTNSDSQLQLRLPSDNSQASARPSSVKSVASYSALPRYRVKVDADAVVTQSKLAKQLKQSCADFVDEGLPVDESMTEFLSSVDRENLASFLSFYDKMTSGDAYERARRNPNNYEAVYY